MANEEKKDEELEGTEEESSEESEADEATEEETDEGTDEGSEDESDDDDESDDNDESDDDESDDDDDESDDDDDESDDEPAAKASGSKSSSSKRRKKTGRKKKKPKTTAGQRLAAAKAAKAARKAAQRGKEAEKVEDKAAEQAEAASRWLEQNRSKLMMLVAAIVLIFAGVFAFNKFAKAGDAEAAKALWEAMEIANARIVDPEEEDEAAEDEEESDEDEEVTFESETARAEAAIEAFDEVIANHAGTQAAAFARIGLANASRVIGDTAEAREAYEAALAESDDPEVALRALEGIGFTYEVDEDWDEAEARFDEMGDIDRPGARILADYHLARIALAKDETEAAKEKLQALLESLDEDDAPQMEFVRDQAEMRLREIDPSLVQSTAPSMFPSMGGPGGGAGGAFGGAGGQEMTPEMQRMLEELMRKQGQ